MEEGKSPEKETFRLSIASQGSPILVMASSSPTKSMRTEIETASEEAPSTERIIEYNPSPRMQTFLDSASTKGSFHSPTGSPPIDNGGPLSSHPYRKSFEVNTDNEKPLQGPGGKAPIQTAEPLPGLSDDGAIAQAVRSRMGSPAWKDTESDKAPSVNDKGSGGNTGIFEGLDDNSAIAEAIKARMGPPIPRESPSGTVQNLNNVPISVTEKAEDRITDDRSSIASRGRPLSRIHVIDVSSGRPWLVDARSGSQAKLVDNASSRASSRPRSIMHHPLVRPEFTKTKVEEVLGISGHIVTLGDLEAGLVKGAPAQARDSLIVIDSGFSPLNVEYDETSHIENASTRALPPTPGYNERASVTAMPPTPHRPEVFSPTTGSTHTSHSRKHSRVNSTLMYDPTGRKASQANSSLQGLPPSPSSSENASSKAILPASTLAFTTHGQSLQPPPSNFSRKVLHVPPPIDTKSNRHSLFQSIARTPYPFSKKNSTRKPPLSASASRESILTLCLRSNNAAAPKLAKIIVPGRNEFNPTADSPAKTKHFTGLDFDDEALFKDMRRNYRKTKGFLRRLLSLRGLKSIGMVASPSSHTLRRHSEKTVHKQASSFLNDQYSQQKLWAHYRKPKLGKGHYEWVDWVHRLPSNAVQGDHISEKIALEFVEGWRVGLLLIAILAVLVLSIAAAVLWVILGLGNGQMEGFMNAGGRVETGAVLAGVVLMMGWTAVGAWASLSWLLG